MRGSIRLPAPAPVPIGQQPPAKAIPTMEPVVVSTSAEQPENAPVPAAVNTPAQGTAPAAAPAVQEPLTKKAAAQAVAAETAAGFGGNRRKYGGERGGIPLPAGEFAA